MNQRVESVKGQLLDLDSWPHTYSYDTSGNLLTDTVTRPDGKQFVKTYTYNATNQLTNESQWVDQ